jgi:AAA+ ATPase superfamily predicted ATPase
METIDLSKAKIGDKFQTRDGQILEYIGQNFECRNDRYELIDEQGLVKYFYQYGNYLVGEKDALDLIVKAPNKPLDELIEEATKEIKENCDAIAEENELQRRQEVVELADRIFFSDRGNIYCFKECVEIAEYSVNIRNQYLNDGKLC